MRVSRSWVLWIAALVVFVAAFLGAGLIVRNGVEATFDADRHVRDARTQVFAMLRAQLDEETGIRGFLATRDARFLDPYKAASVRLPAIFPDLEKRLGAVNASEGVSYAADARRVNGEWIRTIADPTISGKTADALAVQRSGKVLVDRFRADANRIDDLLIARNDALELDFQSAMLSLNALVICAAFMLLAIGLLFLGFQSRAQARLAREREMNEEARERETGLRAAYAAEKQVTDTLQRAFSQRLLPALPSMSFSATYVPAAEEAKVGGDWYDAFEIGEHRILFVIGDIAGHGLEAAVAMSRIRNEMLSAAVLDADPASILQRVNHRMFALNARSSLVTAIVGVADSKNYTFAYATAGHPPPIIAEPDRAPRPLAFGGVPLGVSPKAVYRTQGVQSVPGALLVLYTDGVVEHSRDILEGERQLIASISALKPGDDPATT
ncbi:MAG TPA: SpoIIE family protein phosphatase, partial [Candidatus Acidoferrales bacterium]|nr:SpoIIE family protein phosphatase [Candidatus Acidoferrales bacterium]